MINTIFDFITGNDPYITCISPTGDLWINSRTYISDHGKRRYAYECITDESIPGFARSEDGCMMVIGYDINVINLMYCLKKNQKANSKKANTKKENTSYEV